jgi:hypothetical protein
VIAFLAATMLSNSSPTAYCIGMAMAMANATQELYVNNGWPLLFQIHLVVSHMQRKIENNARLGIYLKTMLD